MGGRWARMVHTAARFHFLLWKLHGHWVLGVATALTLAGVLSLAAVVAGFAAALAFAGVFAFTRVLVTLESGVHEVGGSC